MVTTDEDMDFSEADDGRMVTRGKKPTSVDILPSSLRSSNRKRKITKSDDVDSDAEFNRLLKEHEQILDEKARQKDLRAAKKVAQRGNKRKAVTTHQEHCDVCQQEGELRLCYTCPRAFHIACLDSDLSDSPENDWICSVCEKEGKSVFEEEEKKCVICKESNFLICCDYCESSYHCFCLNPALDKVPSNVWKCPKCLAAEETDKVEKILFWRFVEIKYPDPIPSHLAIKKGEEPTEEQKNAQMLMPSKKMPPRREREFFVKWKSLSYWQCTWVSELAMETSFPHLLRAYWKKYDPNTPPEIVDRSSEEGENSNEEEDYIRYGVKPEWLQIHRILTHDVDDGQYEYYCKWKALSYDQSTWERDDEDFPGYQKQMAKYWIHRERMTGLAIPKSLSQKVKEYANKYGLPLNDKDDAKENKKGTARKIPEKYDQQPEYLNDTGGKLHAYQLEGLNWIRHCWSQKIDAILADEMGLGKTIQALTFLYTLMKEGHSKGPFLVAAPLSTLINWEREAEFWCPDFYVVTYIGDKDSRAVIREHEFSFPEDAVRSGFKVHKTKAGKKVKFHVLLTSYELINVDKTALSRIPWEALVVDEAHRLKNNQSLFFRNLSEYDIKYRLLLTGTPLQNNLEELFHLLNFLSPDRFNDLAEFTHEFSEISKEDQIQKLHQLLGPHMLRRLKADVLTDMPSKAELIVRVDLTPLQKQYYRNILTRNFEALRLNGGTKTSLMNIIMHLRKVCNHPYLITKAEEDAPKLPNGAFEGNALIKAAGKFVLLQKMLRKLFIEKHRVLIFSQMTRMLDILEEFCYFEGYEYERLDGGILGQTRQDAIDRFNAPGAKQFIFLLSTRAGGLGINLATADTVIIYDSDWNPHNDIQAFSRSHRLGQKNKVMIYRFVTRNSVEEKITSVAKKKMLLTHLVVRAGMDNKGPSISKTELDDVLRWGTQELFNDDEADEGEKKSNEQEIVWNDEAVDALLDRNAGEPERRNDGEKKENWTNEYLSSFKVATYVTKVAEEPEEEEQEIEDNENVTEGENEADQAYWEKLLGSHFEQEQKNEVQNFGKGKRVRKPINYTGKEDKQSKRNGNKRQDEDNSDPEFEEEDNEIAGDTLPLLSFPNGLVEVYGFTARQRRAFYNAVMRWGLPPEDDYQAQWLVRDLRQKSDKAFKTYSSLFMRHLCEPEVDGSDTYSDGVPREGLSRQQVLSRIAIISLIRKKVQEFGRVNGDWSLPESRQQSKEQSIGIDNPEASNGPTDEAMKDEKPAEEAKQDERPSPSKFMFNIADGGFTELHTIWCNEEQAAVPNKEYEIWYRRHDYWLLAGIATHGYARFGDIINDTRFDIINLPFKTKQGKANFLQRRSKLLEQALIIEEQLKRAADFNAGEKPIEQQGDQLSKHYSDLEALAESHQSLVKEAANGNRSANIVLRKVLEQLEGLLDEMKSDISKMPSILSRLAPVTERLHMTERQILNRLTTKDPEAAAGLSSLPPPGPFVSPSANQKFSGIQPKFAALHGDSGDYADDDTAEKKPEVKAESEVKPQVTNGDNKPEEKVNGTSTPATNGTSTNEENGKKEEESTTPAVSDVEMKEDVEPKTNGTSTEAAAEQKSNGTEAVKEDEKMDTTSDSTPVTKEIPSTTTSDETPVST